MEDRNDCPICNGIGCAITNHIKNKKCYEEKPNSCINEGCVYSCVLCEGSGKVDWIDLLFVDQSLIKRLDVLKSYFARFFGGQN